MIKKLELKNYRLYKEHTIEFGELEVIKGRNGTGKTTIVEAIAFALFGSALQRGKAKEWITRGERHGSVTLYIDDYVIRRGDSLSVVEDLDGNILARNNTGINEWVEKNYGLTAELYRTSFYIGQKDISAFAALSPMERTKRVEKLLRIDRLDEIKDLAKEKARAAQSNLAHYVSKLESADYSEDKIQDLTASLIDYERELDEERNCLEKLLIKEGEYRQRLAAWRTKLATQQRFKGEVFDIEALEKENEEVLKHNTNVESVNKLVREKVTLLKKLKDVVVLEKYFKCDIRELMSQESNLKKHNILDGKIKELYKKGAEPVYWDLKPLERELDELLKTYRLNKSIPDTCPTCGQDWPDKPSINLTELKEKINSLDTKIKKRRLDTELFDLDKQLLELGEPEMTQTEINEALQSIQNKDAYLRLQELKDVPEKLQEFKTMEVDLRYAREQNNLAARLEELKDIVEPEVVDLKPTKDRIKEIEAAMHAAVEQLKLQENAKAIYEEYADLREVTEAKLDRLKSFIKFIDSYRKSFGNNVIPLLEDNVSKIVTYLSEGKYNSVKINPDYSIADFDFYSGSEQDSVSFALRLAIAQISRLGKFKTMLLDEIAASFDDQREQLLMDILKSQPNQLIYITHGDI